MGKVLMSGIVPKLVTPTPPVTDIPASELAVGNTVYINENGVPKPYLVVHRGKPSSKYDASCDGLWLLRKDIYGNRQWGSYAMNRYGSSSIHSYLNGTFMNLFDADIKALIKTVKIPHDNEDGVSTDVLSGSSGLETKIFLLSGYEIGLTTSVISLIPTDGTKLDYFVSGDTTAARNKRIAYLNSTAAQWWLRSKFTTLTSSICTIKADGTYFGVECTGSYGVRPALIVPFTAVFDEETMVLKGAS